jgi:hypothetical protein
VGFHAGGVGLAGVVGAGVVGAGVMGAGIGAGAETGGGLFGGGDVAGGAVAGGAALDELAVPGACRGGSEFTPAKSPATNARYHVKLAPSSNHCEP